MTIAAVAREADVTERTIYRHFPTREDLLNAAWRRALRAFIRGQTQQVETLDQILELTRAAYENFDANEGIVRAIISAPEGVEVRKRPAEIRLAMLQAAYAELLAGIPQDQVKAVVLATHALSSASVWSHLRDYCGLGRRGRQGRRAGDRIDGRGDQGPGQGCADSLPAILLQSGRRGSDMPAPHKLVIFCRSSDSLTVHTH